jgi:[acyl-carrier-protein] S-malonyltransferase
MTSPFGDADGPVAWIFPGQGSQAVGMGKALYDAYPAVRQLYNSANAILGCPISGLCFNGPADALQQTNHAQPALLVTEIAHLQALKARYANELPQPRFVAGHSLGEYAALVAASALQFEDALRLVAERGRLMQQAGSDMGEPSGMAALLGLDGADLAEVCEQAGVDLANHNAPGQVVISGPQAALDRAAEIARARGARRVIPLQVSAAFHSRWMRPMSEEFGRSIANTVFYTPKIQVIANVTARPVSSTAEIASLLEAQTYSPVRWVESVQYMASEGVRTFIEVGPGKVLSGLVKRITPDARTLSSEDLLGSSNE